jgi:putative oxygen-independent coproporphyrinogen III oxidase
MTQFDLSTIPLALYVHIPWCEKKCPYCDFNSHTLKNIAIPEKEYIEALTKNILHFKQLTNNRSISNIFFGGGTPSLFSAKAIADILQIVNNNYTLDKNIEITLEANPGAIETSKFQEFKEAGVNRISLGVQSFNDNSLKKLGRIHDSAAAQNAIKAAIKANFDNINIDIMYALPEQNQAMCLADLKTALSFGLPHLSWYQLTIEPNTMFYTKRPPLPKSSAMIAMEEAGIAYLEQQQMQRYEISAWTNNATKQCLHNYNTWQFGDYIGIGAGGCGKITLENSILRTMQSKHPSEFMNSNNHATEHFVKSNELAFEFMLCHMRLKEPLLFDTFEQRTNLHREVLWPIISKIPADMCTYDNHKLTLTSKGFNFYNDLVEMFLP